MRTVLASTGERSVRMWQCKAWHRSLYGALLGVILAVAGCAGTEQTRGIKAVSNPVIVFVRMDGSSGADWIWISDGKGRDARRLTQGYEPTVSPDGRWITFSRGDDLFGDPTYELDRLTGRVRLIRANGFGPCVWALNSKTFLLQVGKGKTYPSVIEVIDPNKLTGRVIARGVLNVDTTISPDGKEIAYSAVVGHLGTDLFAVGINGDRYRRLTTDGRSQGPVWGKSLIAYSRIATRSPNNEVWVLRLRGRRRPLSWRISPKATPTASWQPIAWWSDGSRLLIGDIPDGQGVGTFNELDLYTHGVKEIFNEGTLALFSAQLSRNGKYLLVVDGETSLVILSVRDRMVVRRVSGPVEAYWNR